MAALHILYVVSQWGAPTQTFVRREVDAARAAGNAVTVVSLKRPPSPVTTGLAIVQPGATAPLRAGLTVLRHPIRSARVLARAVRGSRPRTLPANVTAVILGMAAAARVPQVDWIHAHFAWVAASAADAIAAVRNQPYSVFPHAFDIFDDRYIDDYTTEKLQRAAFVVVESPSIRDEVNDRFSCGATVARMGVPPQLVAPLPPLTETRGRVVSVGSLLPKKGHDVLIRAVAKLSPHSTLTIIGEGPERSALTDLARSLGIEERVRLAGSMPEEDVVAALDAADAFCLASRPTAEGDRDGVPNVLIEAMARGVPCVSTRVSGIPDLLGDGRGVLVAPDDPSSLAEALRTLLEQPNLAASIAEAAHAHVETEYRTDRNWARLEDRIHTALCAEEPIDA